MPGKDREKHYFASTHTLKANDSARRKGEPLTVFENPKMLHFLAAARRARIAGRPLCLFAGLAGDDLALFRAVAIERGFLDRDDRVTVLGLGWVDRQLAPFSSFFSTCADLESRQ